MKNPAKNITRLVKSIQISDVRLVEANIKTRVRAPNEAGPIEFSVSPSTKVEGYAQKGSFLVLATMIAKVIPTKNKKSPVVSIKSVFELEYSYPEEMTFSKGEMQEFAKINGVFNAWPFWREFIQSSFNRMQLPPITLPVYRVQREAKKDSKKDAK